MMTGSPPLMILGGILSLFGGLFGKKKTTTQVQEQTIQVGSKIDVTNKQLEIVNRNLVALRQTFEGFILPRSSYFGSPGFPRSLEDQLSEQISRGTS
jgi:hypothetical protein